MSHPYLLLRLDKNISPRVSAGLKRDDHRLGCWDLYGDDPVVSFIQGNEIAAKNRETDSCESSGI
jgi:hypothetical protein